MQCAHAEKLIPLFAGDDLPARETGALRRHLESCANCRNLAAEFEESRDWLRGLAAPQFDDAMLDDLRGSVMREIGRDQNRARWFQWIVPGWNLRFAFAMSLASLLFIALFNLMINSRQPPHDPKYNQSHVEKSAANQVESPPGVTPKGRADNDERIASVKSGRRGFKRKPLKPGPNESPQTEARIVEPELIAQNVDADEPSADQSAGPDPANTAPDTTSDMLRIEIQTADPNIRIIWFAPKSDTAPTTSPNTK